MSEYPRGSEWRRWDLHIHTPLSYFSNQFPKTNGEIDWDRYLTRLEQSGIAVAGITDYFTIDGYKTLLDFKRQGRLQGITLLPNVEFRLDKFISARSDGASPRRLNYHVIFSESVAPQDIEDHFLHDLNFNYEDTPGEAGSRLSLKATNFTMSGERLLAQHARFSGMSALEVGAMTAVVDLKEITEKLASDPRFKGRYLLVLPAQDWDAIPWDGQDHLTRKLLLKGAHVVMASNPKTVSWCLGTPPYSGAPSNFAEEFGSLKPCVWGSDAHSLQSIGRPCTKRSEQAHQCSDEPGVCDLRHCWIKADPTFEGLRQILCEPADRVWIQAVDPTPAKSIFSLAEVHIAGVTANGELTITETTLPLNTSLVAVTGGKGTGKTALVDLLAHCFSDRQHTADRNSFVRRIALDAPTLEVELTFLGGNAFAKHLNDGVFFEDGAVAYIAQGELERYIDEHSDLNEYIHSLIFSSAAIKDTVISFEYESQVKAVQELQNDVTAKGAVIAELEGQTSPQQLADVERAGKEAKGELKDVTSRLAQVEALLTKEAIEANSKRQERVSLLKASRDTLVAARDLTASALRAIDSDLVRLAGTIQRLNETIAQMGLGTSLAVPEYPDRTRLVEVGQAIAAKLRTVVAEIEEDEKKISATTVELGQHRKLLAKKQELEGKIAQLRERYKTLQQAKERLVQERTARQAAFKGLLEGVIAQRSRYSDVIAAFGEAKEKILEDLDFAATVTCDAESLIQDLEALVDNRAVHVAGADRSASVCAPIVGLLERYARGDTALSDDIAREVERLRSELATKLKRAVGLVALDRVLYQSRLGVYPLAKYKGTALDRLSLGQKATVLIKIYLAEDDKPIIIDSHDDHLDNEYIMAELVGAIREAKQYRQVIIASNNGNVVMNSDAEQVIVAHRDSGTISYVSGALEDPEVREMALSVLEGGREAFQRRQAKYRIDVGR